MNVYIIQVSLFDDILIIWPAPVQSWSELLAPLVNMIKGGSENKPALLILLIFYLKNN